MEDGRIIPAPSAVYGAEVWTRFGFRNKEGAEVIDKSHARVCETSQADTRYSGNTTNRRARSSKAAF